MELLTYVLMSFASLIGPVLGLGLLGAGPHEPATVYAFAVCAAIIALGGRREARRDLDKLVTFATGFGFVWTLIYGAAAFIDYDGRVGYGISAVLLGALTIACGVRVVRSALWKDTLPNLRSLGWAPRELYEFNGVQFGVAHDAPDASRTTRVIRIAVQNCMNAPREVRFSFTPDHRGAKEPAVSGSATLGPLHVGTLLIELPGRLPGGRFAIVPAITGPDGKRERRWRATPYSAPVSGGFQLVAILAGVLVWGGGMWLTIPAAQSGPSSAAEPIVTWKRIWPTEDAAATA